MSNVETGKKQKKFIIKLSPKWTNKQKSTKLNREKRTHCAKLREDRFVFFRCCCCPLSPLEWHCCDRININIIDNDITVSLSSSSSFHILRVAVHAFGHHKSSESSPNMFCKCVCVCLTRSTVKWSSYRCGSHTLASVLHHPSSGIRMVTSHIQKLSPSLRLPSRTTI